MISESIEVLHEKLKNNEVTSDYLVNESLNKCHSIQEKTNAFVTIIDDTKGSSITEELVSGIPLVLKITFQLKIFYLLVVLIL